jgi:hypothetical protein
VDPLFDVSQKCCLIQPEPWMHFFTKGFIATFVNLNFAPNPRGEVVPQGWILSPKCEVIPCGWSSLFAPLFVRTVECWPLGVNEGVNIPPRGTIFTPRGKLHPWGQTMLLKAGLRLLNIFFYFLTPFQLFVGLKPVWRYYPASRPILRIARFCRSNISS